MYQNLEQFIEEKVKEFEKAYPLLTALHAEHHDLFQLYEAHRSSMREFLRTTLRQCAELTCDAVVRYRTVPNEDRRSKWLNKE